MATIKVILKENKKDINGEIPLYLRIIKDRKTKFISLGVKIKQKDWNAAQSTVKKSHPNSAWLNNFIDQKKSEAQGISLEMESKSKFVEAKNIKKEIMGKNSEDFISYAEAFLAKSKSTYSYGSYEVYTNSINKVKNYIGKSDFTFNDFNIVFLTKYEKYLREELENSSNTINCNFKNLRRIFSEAIKDNVISYEKNPFLRYKVKTTKTNIDFLTEEELALIENLELKQDSFKYHTRNLYIFACYAAGLRISDLLNLRWLNFDGERLIISTQKTSTTVSIKMPEKALQIIALYKPEKINASDLIFPFYSNDIDFNDIETFYTLKSSIKSRINIALKSMAKVAEIKKNVHFHTSRHTFATRALRKGARIEFVSKLLGHASIRTTQIYASIVNEDLDNAMELFN
jgi:integrase